MTSNFIKSGALRSMLGNLSKSGSDVTKGPPKLNLMQKQIWTHQQLHPNSLSFTMMRAWRINGDLNPEELAVALNKTVASLDALRMTVHLEDDIPTPRFSASKTLRLNIEDVVAQDGMSLDDAMAQHIRVLVETPIDINAQQLFNVTLLRMSAREHVLCVSIQHIIADDWSFEIFTDVFSRHYNGTAAHSKRPSFEDYLSIVHPEASAETSDQTSVLDWPISGARVNSQSYSETLRVIQRTVPVALKNQLQDVANSANVSVFAILLTAYQTVLHHFCAQKSLSTNISHAIRDTIDAETTFGMFVDASNSPSNITNDTAFRTQIQINHKHILNLPTAKNTFSDSTVDTSIVFYNAPSSSLSLLGLEVIPEFMPVRTAPSLVHLSIRNNANGELDLELAAQTAVFDAEIQAVIGDKYLDILEIIARDPDAKIRAANLVSVDEHAEIVALSIDVSPYPHDLDVPHAFAQMVDTFPDMPALESTKGSWTYLELDNISNKAAVWLHSLGLKQGDVIGISLPKGATLIVLTLAALKSGLTIAPLDIQYPAKKLCDMINIAGCNVIITVTDIFQETDLNVRVYQPLDIYAKDGGVYSAPTLTERRTERAAYLTFTSGSTGKPKAVITPHRGIVRLVKNTGTMRIESTDRLLQLSSPSFDAALYEIWGALLNGAVLITPEGDHSGLAEITQDIRNHQITVCFITTSLFNLILDESPQSLSNVRWLRVGGEAMSPTHANKALLALPNTVLDNVYGPTENTAFSSQYVITKPQKHTVPIGRPASNNMCFVLNDQQKLVPIGFSGELYVGGDGLSLGYKSLPDETAEKFVNIASENLGLPAGKTLRLYRTGDRARWNMERQIEYLGRIDLQLKLNGFRIEPAEIERALLKHTKIEAVAIIPKNNEATGQVTGLVAFYKSDKHQISSSDARTFLLSLLPRYLMPTEFYQLDALPLTKNGKIDSKSLTEIAKNQRQPTLNTLDDIPLEMIAIWEQLLDRTIASSELNFFEIGGHSLLAMQMLSRVNRQLKCTITISDFLRNPTLQQLDKIFKSKRRTNFVTNNRVSLLRDGDPNLTPIVCLAGINGEVIWARDILDAWPDDRPVLGLGYGSKDEWKNEPCSLDEIADELLKDLKIATGGKPTHLLGFSFGGTLATVMKMRNENDGTLIDKVINLDSSVNLGFIRNDTFDDSAPYPRPLLERLNEQYVFGLSDLDTHSIVCMRQFQKSPADKSNVFAFMTTGQVHVYEIDTFHPNLITQKWAGKVVELIDGVINETLDATTILQGYGDQSMLDKLNFARDKSWHGDIDTTISQYENLLDHACKLPNEIYESLAELYVEARYLGKFKKLRDTMAISNINKPETWVNVGIHSISMKDPSLTTSLFNHAMLLDPNGLKGAFQLARYYFFRGQIPKAKVLAEKLTEHPRHFSEGNLILAHIAVKNNASDEANTLIIRALSVDNISARHYIYAATEVIGLRNHNAAIAILDMAIAFDPRKPQFRKLRKKCVEIQIKSQE